jgi:hypothetical protein
MTFSEYIASAILMSIGVAMVITIAIITFPFILYKEIKS